MEDSAQVIFGGALKFSIPCHPLTAKFGKYWNWLCITALGRFLSQNRPTSSAEEAKCFKFGVKGHRTTVGTRDGKHLVYIFAVVNMVTATVYANLVESPQDAMKRMGQNKNRRLQEEFAAHLRHLGWVDPRDKHEWVVLVVDNAPWQAGQVVSEALAGYFQTMRGRVRSLIDRCYTMSVKQTVSLRFRVLKGCLT